MVIKRIIPFTVVMITLVGCAGNALVPQTTATAPIVDVSPTAETPSWSVYDANPNHLWNRVFRQFYRRVSQDGTEYGMDELDPLLWYDTTYLLEGEAHQLSLQILDEFLKTNGESLIQDPLKRAMFQRDLWAVFDWLSFQTEPYTSQRLALKTRLAQIMRRVALTAEQILSLPDNYALVIEAKTFPDDFQAENPQAAFLPADLFQENSAWVPVGREGGPIALSHTKDFPFSGRSVFLVFLRSADGKESTLDLIQTLNTKPETVETLGLDVALVRRMLLIDNQGDLVLSPLIESIQIRHFNPGQIFQEFELSRKSLFRAEAGGIHLNKELFLLFSSHGDVFEFEGLPSLQTTIPQICTGCHFENPPLPNPGNIESIISYSRENFPLPDNKRPVLHSTNWVNETQVVSQWKRNHESWATLKSLWDQSNP